MREGGKIFAAWRPIYYGEGGANIFGGGGANFFHARMRGAKIFGGGGGPN